MERVRGHSENNPAVATAPAASQRLKRRISPRPASRAVTARNKGSVRIARESWCGTEVRLIADDSSDPAEAITKQSVSCL
jgi:hypothetical protein